MPNHIDQFEQEEFAKLEEGRTRPYDGQPHTDAGERGKTLVEGLTMRDVADCIDLAFFQASGIPRDQWPQYSWQLRLETMDPVAIRQNAMCNVEKMMDIFPNVPALKATADE